MVTGAAGSIGSELCRQMARFGPRGDCGVRDRGDGAVPPGAGDAGVVSRGGASRRRSGTCRTGARLAEVLEAYRPSMVFHAAAYKHVPMMEAHLFEAVENNVFGTRTVAEAAARHGVEEFVMISTDKAVRPTSVMGATKRVAELVVNSLQNGGTRFCLGAVRERAGVERERGPALQGADRGGRAGDGDASGDAAVLHDDPGGGRSWCCRRRRWARAARSSCWTWASR